MASFYELTDHQCNWLLALIRHYWKHGLNIWDEEGDEIAEEVEKILRRED